MCDIDEKIRIEAGWRSRRARWVALRKYDEFEWKVFEELQDFSRWCLKSGLSKAYWNGLERSDRETNRFFLGR